MSLKQPDPIHILRDPLTNKGTAFSQDERDALFLNGLLPFHLSSVDEQLDRIHRRFEQKKTPLGKYNFLSSLMDRNEILFYLFAEKYIQEVFPLVYTPTVGEASQQYSLIFRRPRGLYISYPLKDKMDEMIQSIPRDDISISVVTDGERILGLGDLGIGGMAIPVGKLSLYSLFGGIHPRNTLPVILDVGTDNEELQQHPLYLGYKRPRVRGKDYDDFIHAFITALYKRFPSILLQWEDFGKNNAFRLLSKYREKYLSFNDDIQGTAAVTLAGILAACKVTGKPITRKKVVILGGGSAGMGIAYDLASAMILQGLSEQEAHDRIFIVDSKGLIMEGKEHSREEQKPFIKPISMIREWEKSRQSGSIDFFTTVHNVQPDILIGVSTQGGAFSEEILNEMSKYTLAPIVFPLSNPTDRAEAFPEEIMKWTKGKALIATGSPFQPVVYEGEEYEIGQCNNVYIFPGLGMGAIAVKASKVTDKMFLVAAEKLASFSPRIKKERAPLFPYVTEIRNVSKEIAKAVGHQAIEEGVAQPIDVDNAIEEIFWNISYENFSKA